MSSLNPYLSFSVELVAQWWYFAFLAVLGAALGSFAGVLIGRIPAKESLTKRSSCANCDAPIRWYHNIPLISWPLLGGRCSNCKAAIPVSVWMIEALCAGGWVVGGVLTNDPLSAVAFGMLVLFAVVLGAIDWKTSYIHMRSYAGFGGLAWGFAAVALVLSDNLSNLWMGLGVGFGIAVFFEIVNGLYYLLRRRHGLGGGDSLLVLVCAGVPVALSGDWVVGVYGVLVGILAGVIGGGIAASRYEKGVADPYLETTDTEDPDEAGSAVTATDEESIEGEGTEEVPMGQRVFALGPFLLAGPFLAWIVVELTGFRFGL